MRGSIIKSQLSTLGDVRQLGVSFCTFEAISLVMKGDDPLPCSDVLSVSRSR